MLSNFHTHSRWCDGKGELREYVEVAIANGFRALGFSGHAPVPFPSTFAIKDDQYTAYCNEIRALKEEYKDRIDISLGLEIDYIPGILEDFTPLIEKGGLEYTIGSVHLIPAPLHTPSPLRGTPPNLKPDNIPGSSPKLGEGDASKARVEECVKEDCTDWLWFIDGPKWERYDEGLFRLFSGDIHSAVRAYFHQQNAMLERNRPTIVGHPDKIVMHNRDRYFTEDEPWYRSLALETIHLIKELGLICEINTRGIYKGRHADYYPGKWLIQEMKQLRIPVIVSTDAHAPEDLLRTEGAYDYLREISYPEILDTWR